MKTKFGIFHPKESKFNFAYFRLTAFYVLIIMTISITFSIVVYNTSTHELDNGLGRQSQIFRDIPIDALNSLNDYQNFDQIQQNQLSQSSNHLQQNLVLLNMLILLISSFASYFFAQKTLEPIEESMESQNRFTADASHELRTPLTAMKTEIEVALRDGKLSQDEMKKLLSSNLEEVGKLESLTSALLKLARYQNQTEKNFSEVCLKSVITEAYEKIEANAAKKNITFETNLDDCSSVILPKNRDTKDGQVTSSVVNGDEASLIELFTILLDNAVKYSPAKSKIQVFLKNEGNKTIVLVRDRGIGIKSSDLPYVFNRFYRADLSRSKEKVDGYGLGLSIAKNIVDYHKGQITVKSKPGTGTQFTVSLPRY